ncbi:MAG: serine hydrolase [Verrucomicrobiota bacterium]|nr:serine hydrolase [Verrucomicrobiota bacterium]
MKPILSILRVAVAISWATGLTANELPRLEKGLKAEQQYYQEQKKLPYLKEAYFSTSPEDLRDGLKVGRLDLPGTGKAVRALIRDDKAGKYSNLDSILLWKDGKLLFEMYNRRGRVDGPHYAMSITKTLTSVTLARAIQMGLLSMEDLDKPVISFMPGIDPSKIQPGVKTITLREALYMKSGLRYPDKNFAFNLGQKYKRQHFFQHLFEKTAPITAANKEYKYTGSDPSLIMMIIDVKTGGKVQQFIAREIADKFGAIYCWDNQGCGIPKCGAGSNFTSRSLLKIGTAVIQGGRYNGQQLLSSDYIRQVMNRKKGEGYFYYFHNRKKIVAGKEIYLISGIGAGGQYMATFPELNIVAVATAHNKKQIGPPLNAILEHLIPLFLKQG